MNCDVCKTDVNVRTYRFLSDGVPKEVHLCTGCLRKTLKEADSFDRKNLKYIAGYTRVVQDSNLGELLADQLSPRDLVFSIVPVGVLGKLFGKESAGHAQQKEVIMRHLYILRHRLEEALKKEDYRSAHKIKNQISMIEKTLLEK